LHEDFEKHVQTKQETGLEFWLARDLQDLLGYAKWENFTKVIDKLKVSCKNAGSAIAFFVNPFLTGWDCSCMLLSRSMNNLKQLPITKGQQNVHNDCGCNSP